MSEQQENTALTDDVQKLEATLRGLWNKTKQAAELIQSLREQNRTLIKQVDDLEANVETLQSQLTQREDEVRLMQQQIHEIRNNGLGMMDSEQKAELRKQIAGLIEKINSHL